MDNATRIMELPQLPNQVLAIMPPVQRMYVRKCYDVLTDVFIASELELSLSLMKLLLSFLGAQQLFTPALCFRINIMASCMLIVMFLDCLPAVQHNEH